MDENCRIQSFFLIGRTEIWCAGKVEPVFFDILFCSNLRKILSFEFREKFIEALEIYGIWNLKNLRCSFNSPKF